MKRAVLGIGLVLFILVGVSVFYNKLYFPPLPIENVTKKEVIKKVKDSDEQMVKLSNENGHEWYIISERDSSVAKEMIKEMVSQNGWIFKHQDGAGLFFEKDGERLIVTTQKWKADYELVKIPTDFKE